MRVTPAERALVARWTDTGYEEINGAIRSGRLAEDPYAAKEARSLKRMIARSPELPIGTVLYRGAFAPTKRGEVFTQAKIGAEMLLDPTFASTSESRGIAETFPKHKDGPDGAPIVDRRPKVLFELTVAREGVRALDVDSIYEYVGLVDGGEDEWLLPPNTKIVVRDVKRLPALTNSKLVRADIVATPT